MKKYNVAIIGATGLVGKTLLSLLIERAFPIKTIRLFASIRSKGKTLTVKGLTFTVENLNENSFNDCHFAFFCADTETTMNYVPIAIGSGCIVIDNSSTYRMDKNVPLCVPEINATSLYGKNLIANPNCSSIIASLPLFCLDRIFGLKKAYISTYQAVSGAGTDAIEDLMGENEKLKIFPYPIKNNLLPAIGDIDFDGAYTEEIKLEKEIPKIFGKQVSVHATAVRVPIINCHSESIVAIFDKKVNINDAEEALMNFKHIDYFSNTINTYPMPLWFNGKENIGVGRLRITRGTTNSLSLWVTGDNILKGAALNALQIAEMLTGLN